MKNVLMIAVIFVSMMVTSCHTDVKQPHTQSEVKL